MTAQAIHQQQLSNLLTGWDRRRRLMTIIQWLPRAIMIGSFAGIAAGVVSRLRPFLTNNEVGLTGLIGVSVCLAGLYVIVWLWPRKEIDSARYFDLTFGLKERMSTALELSTGQIQANDLLTSGQLEDAYANAQTIQPAERLLIQMNRREWGGVAVMIAALLLLVFLPNPQTQALTQSTAAGSIIPAAADTVGDAIQEVAADPSLTPTEREELLNSLETNLETLQDEDISEEEALATVNDVEDLLSEQSSTLNEDAQHQQDALEAAAEALGDPQEQTNNHDQQQSASNAVESSTESIETMMEGIENATPEQNAAMADTLDAAATALEATAPQAAEALREAANALREDDIQAAQEALQQAQQELQQALQQQENTQQSADQMQELADQMRIPQQQLGQQDSPPPQQGNQQGQSADQQQQGEQPGQQANQDGQQGQPQPSNQQGDQQRSGQNGQTQQGQGETTNGSSQESGASQPPNSNSNRVGEAPGSQAGDTTGGEDTGQEQQGGGEAGGEDQFEEIFAPRRPNVEIGDTEIILEPDAGDVPLAEGDFTDNPFGNVTVPYNQIFPQAYDRANEALDQDYIPLGMRDVVREYFTSLAPRSNDTGE